MSTQETAALIESVNNMTATVAGKMGEIDQKVADAEAGFETWKATTSYVQTYSLADAEGSKESDKNTGHYHLIKLYTIRNSLAAQHPWIHIGFTGINCVGAGHFCSLAQSHAHYTGQSAMFTKRGNGDVKFFIDRANANNAPVYMAIKNTAWGNAAVSVHLSSYMSLDVESLGAVDLAVWQGDNASLIEIETVDITTQPAPGA